MYRSWLKDLIESRYLHSKKACEKREKVPFEKEVAILGLGVVKF
jgi:hypothetical protein